MPDLHDAPSDDANLEAELEHELERLMTACCRSGPVSYEAQHALERVRTRVRELVTEAGG